MTGVSYKNSTITKFGQQWLKLSATTAQSLTDHQPISVLTLILIVSQKRLLIFIANHEHTVWLIKQ